MGLFDNCIFACDVDDTLMDNNHINPRNIEKIEFFIKEGGCFALASGRGLFALKLVANKLKSVSKCIAGNGSIIYDFEKSEILYEDLIPYDDYSVAEQILQFDKNVGIEFYSGELVYTLNLTQELRIHQEYEKFYERVISFSEAKELKWSKVLYTFENEAHRERIKAYIQTLNPRSNLVYTCANIDGVTYHYYEQLPFSATKLTGINRLQEILNLKNGLIIAMGDYYNDIEMLQGADISAVPAGSPPQVAQYAEFVAGSCKDGAVADFIDYLTSKFSEA